MPLYYHIVVIFNSKYHTAAKVESIRPPMDELTYEKVNDALLMER